MGLTIDEFQPAAAAAKERLSKDVSRALLSREDRKAQLRTYLRDVVAAEHLTADENWDRYLSWLSGAKAEIEKAVEAWTAKLKAPAVVSHDDLIRAKLALAGLESQLLTLDWVMELPKQLKAGAVDVKERLAVAEVSDE